jgi:DNA-binding NarL/FixJ family response regulator
MIKIGIFEDYPIVVKSLIDIITNQSDMQLLFAEKTKDGFYEKLNTTEGIDVLIVDVLADDVIGTEVYQYLNSNFPNLKVIAFTSLSSPVFVDNLLAIGIKGYVSKNQDIEDIIKAIRLVYNDKIYVPTELDFLLHHSIQKPENLTFKEIEIIKLISLEFTTQDIAKQLKISISTVETHRRNIFNKLQVKNIAGLMREAIKLGYI